MKIDHPLPYYAVIFTSTLSDRVEGYEAMANKMIELASKETGFLGVDSARSEIGITVSYWSDLNSIKTWKNKLEHKVAQNKGKQQWYTDYSVHICEIIDQYQKNKK